MGPLASAEFLKTLYEFNLQDQEQKAPHCILYSDPGIPDRTKAILSGRTAEVSKRLLKGLLSLQEQGAKHLIIACISSHFFLQDFPISVRESIISLVEVTLDEISSFPGKSLLLATTGTVKAQTFQNHPSWSNLRGKLHLPDPDDQKCIHSLIYNHLKLNRETIDEDLLRRLKKKYKVDTFVAGCTEFHLANKQLLASGNPEFHFIDPLYTVGREIRNLQKPVPSAHI